MQFNDMLDRFIGYVTVDTAADSDSKTFPSTEKQLNLAKKLHRELVDMGLAESATITRWGYVLATVPGNRDRKVPTIALIAHMDTSPDISGRDVKPKVHRNYSGGDIDLSGDGACILKVSEFPYLKEKAGKTVITTDGTTLLGADDKAGVAEIMSAVQYLLHHPEMPRPPIRILFTPDEEVGRGTEHITVEEIGADFGYTVDGGEIGEIDDESFCADSLDIVIRGINIHPGNAFGKMVNSIKVAAEIIEQFPKDSLSPETTDKREGYIHPNTIAGSVEETRIKMIIRDFEERGLKEKEDHIRAITAAVARKFPKVSIDVVVSESYRNMIQVLNRYPHVVEKAEKAVILSGIQPKRCQIRGGTDGSRLSFMGLPCPNIFNGSNNVHSRYEWICLEDMERTAMTLVHLMKLWAEE